MIDRIKSSLQWYIRNNYGKHPKYLIINKGPYYTLLEELNSCGKITDDIKLHPKTIYLGMYIIVTDSLDQEFDIV